MTKINVSKFLAVTVALMLLSSCANMQAMIENQVQEEKEVSVDQKLQVSIPVSYTHLTLPTIYSV